MYKFSTKGRTLKNLRLKNAVVPKLYLFNLKEFFKNKKKILDYIKNNFNEKIIVRSSNFKEDNNNNSFAGYFESVPNVNPKNNTEVIEAISKVISSYKKFKSLKNEILIQKMLNKVDASGVIFTTDINTLSPYYVIDIYEGNDTTAVTSGKFSTQQIVISKYHKLKKNNKFRKLINLSKELERLFKNDKLDIEFAIFKNSVYLLQVRPLSSKIVKKNINKNQNNKIYYSLKKIKKKIIKLQRPHPNLDGKTTYFGVMPDWNPAEIIGIKPKPLALSIYQELITDHVWSESRKRFGFKDVTSNHLMTNFYGTPYIDVRVDCNSWIPNGLPPKTSQKLVLYYLNEFKSNLDYHDKIEFKILFTCLTPSTKLRLKKLKNQNFSQNEILIIEEKLKEINKLAVKEIDNLVDKIDVLKTKQKQLKNTKMYPIDKIYWYLEDCKKFGTYAFAGLARCGFIAIEILNSMVEQKILTVNEKNNYLQNIKTITTELIKDRFKLDKSNFLNKYGHLRPNTYEIESKNYRDGYNQYFSSTKKYKQKIIKKFVFKKSQKIKISKFLKENELNINIKQLNDFIKKSIYYREYGKFVFTKSIDLIFSEIRKIGKINKINLNDLSFLEIENILKLYYNLNDENISSFFKSIINKNRKSYYYNRSIRLPETIIKADDVFYFLEKAGKTNFVTNKLTTAKIMFVSLKNSLNLNGKIVVIESADPGYDFIFNANIQGLITKYGGANSHMSIRCSELNIPAAIGVGNKVYENLKKASSVELNCQLNKIKIL